MKPEDHMHTAIRECPRYSCEIDVGVRIGERNVQGRCVNLSQGGLFVEIDAPPQLGESVEISHEALEGPQSGVVAWRDPEDPRGFGVQFEDAIAVAILKALVGQ